ncbi:MAG: hypothetical protein PWQ18_266 [Clostridia bacterium]|nr:hypothetical protein [Clostridia bacterium]
MTRSPRSPSSPGSRALLIPGSGLCVGCKMHLLACPFGSIHFDAGEQVSEKCDLCGGDPRCVKFCISGALQLVEEQEAYSFRRLEFDGALKQVLRLCKDGRETGWPEKDW